MWGDWMGAWKAEAGETVLTLEKKHHQLRCKRRRTFHDLEDVEQDRLSRAQAAFGGETMARMKDTNFVAV